MAKVSVYNIEGKVVGEMNLKDEVFSVEVNENLLHKSVVEILNNKRQGTKKQKTRAEVRGGGRKPWKQKGTGHARQGSIRAPQWKGGGMVFAAVPKEYELRMNKKERRLAIKSALTNCVKDNNLFVIDSIRFDEIKTKNMVKVLDNLKIDKALLVLDVNDKNVIISARNLQNVKTGSVNEINTYDLLKYGKLLITKKAVETLEEVYA